MSNAIEIQNIDEMRRVEGIDDIELRTEIRGLRIGSLVKLTFLCGAASFETVLVQITSVRGSSFRGKFAKQPRSNGLADYGLGAPFAFTAAHIHSIVRPQTARES